MPRRSDLWGSYDHDKGNVIVVHKHAPSLLIGRAQLLSSEAKVMNRMTLPIYFIAELYMITSFSFNNEVPFISV